jgi:hypothetical protein
MAKKKPAPQLPKKIPQLPEEVVAIAGLKDHPRNYKKHPQAQLEHIAHNIRRDGIWKNVVISRDNFILGGHGVVAAARMAGVERAPVRRLPYKHTHPRALAVVVADNETGRLAETDDQALASLLSTINDYDGLVGTGIDASELVQYVAGAGGGSATNAGSLSERFLVPPFTVLDARQGYWQERKRQWLALGIRSELGRGENLLKYSDTLLQPDAKKRAAKKAARTFGQDLAKGEHKFGPGKVAPTAAAPNPEATGTSIFDPVLCELIYRWFSPKGGTVLDPFAGGSVRGIVASKLGRKYVGIDLRGDQIKANEKQARDICRRPEPRWLEGDSADIPQLAGDVRADLIFSCPPYGDLEVYSEDPRDLSTLEYARFVDKFRKIVAGALAQLRADRFACFVVGDIRAPDGTYRGFVADTQRAFADAGARLYNEGVLVTPVGSLPIRTSKQFTGSRKLGKTHQNVLVFCKGDPIKATKACGKVDVADPAEGFGEVVDAGAAAA